MISEGLVASLACVSLITYWESLLGSEVKEMNILSCEWVWEVDWEWLRLISEEATGRLALAQEYAQQVCVYWKQDEALIYKF